MNAKSEFGTWRVEENPPPFNGSVENLIAIERDHPHQAIAFTGPRSKREARLIAAAPDLLASCEHFVNHCQACGIRAALDSLSQIEQAHAMALIAIAKSKGKANEN